MRLLDTVQLATTTTDGYGDKTVTVLTTAKAAFVQRTGVQHSQSADGTLSDATIYLDPKNDVVTANLYRLEGMYIVANPFGDSRDVSWYRIQHVTVGQRKLLTNTIDNIYCHLEKEPGAPYVSYIS